MGAPPDADPELLELRARRRAELLERSSEPPRPPAAPTPGPEELTLASFAGFLAANPRVVVDVWAPWCGPCRVLSPTLEELAHELGPEIRFAKVNADEEPAIASRWGVEAIPTLLLFGAGRLVDRVVGVLPKETLRQRFARAFPPEPRASPRR